MAATAICSDFGAPKKIKSDTVSIGSPFISHEVMAVCIRWPKYWSFSISPSNEYSELISLKLDWFVLLGVQGTLKSLLQHHSSKASSVLSFLYGPTLTFVHDYWKNYNVD